ncbi:MAG: hypothetical protein PHP08_04205, partial [Candidatus Dojkabacteria bacterium]|nr:hypothetical protein [Candidatus Dojkabacteria bacterium]
KMSMVEQLPNLELESIAQNNSYGLLIFKPDAVEKDLVEPLIHHVLSSEPFIGNAEVEDLCVLPPLTNTEDIRKIYPCLDGDIWEANKRLFASNYTVIFLLKGENINMWQELEKIKGKVITNTTIHGLKDGLRGIIPTVGEKQIFLKIRDKKERKEVLSIDDHYYLCRNLVHTPDTYNERLSILELMKTYKKNGNYP